LLLLLTTPPVNEVVNEPVKKRLVSEALEVMDMTWPLRPLNSGADHEFDLEFQTATEGPGDEKRPPTQRLSLGESQYTALIGPSGPPEPRAEKAAEEGE
jgi:hypothetical protein